MYRASRPLAMVASRGMRRILKRQGSIAEYIRQAVQAGTYRTSEELQRMKRPDDTSEAQQMAARLRQNVVRGSSIVDYPAEYVILQQHPPLPDPPVTPKRRQKQRVPKQNDRLQALVHQYYHLRG